jgi:hypothetical protein
MSIVYQASTGGISDDGEGAGEVSVSPLGVSVGGGNTSPPSSPSFANSVISSVARSCRAYISLVLLTSM